MEEAEIRQAQVEALSNAVAFLLAGHLVGVSDADAIRFCEAFTTAIVPDPTKPAKSAAIASVMEQIADRAMVFRSQNRG